MNNKEHNIHPDLLNSEWIKYTCLIQNETGITTITYILHIIFCFWVLARGRKKTSRNTSMTRSKSIKWCPSYNSATLFNNSRLKEEPKNNLLQVSGFYIFVFGFILPRAHYVKEEFLTFLFKLPEIKFSFLIKWRITSINYYEKTTYNTILWFQLIFYE